ncbi:MAG TPA: peptide deformylase [bacterium]|nr:peptide deformylase [bacterium]HPN29814.1 peptide deformylase [bacterium]
MTIREIKICGDPILRKKAEKVSKISKSVKQLIIDMFETLNKAKGVGLAAPQIGVSKSIIIIDLSESKYNFRMAMINPKILKKYGEEDYFSEGCLSVPEIWTDIKRPTIIDIEYEDADGKKQKITGLSGMPARVAQHELDHLNGILFIDKAESKNKEFVRQSVDILIKKTKLKTGNIIL